MKDEHSGNVKGLTQLRALKDGSECSLSVGVRRKMLQEIPIGIALGSIGASLVIPNAVLAAHVLHGQVATMPSWGAMLVGCVLGLAAVGVAVGFARDANDSRLQRWVTRIPALVLVSVFSGGVGTYVAAMPFSGRSLTLLVAGAAHMGVLTWAWWPERSHQK